MFPLMPEEDDHGTSRLRTYDQYGRGPVPVDVIDKPSHCMILLLIAWYNELQLPIPKDSVSKLELSQALYPLMIDLLLLGSFLIAAPTIARWICWGFERIAFMTQSSVGAGAWSRWIMISPSDTE